MDIIYAKKITDTCGNKLTSQILRETFKQVIEINNKLLSDKKRVAYFFIDPLMNSFEAANYFYFNVLECHSITRINTYKSGAGPIQALSDAKELVDNNLYDAVFVFGQEFLLSDTKKYGKAEIKKAMDIFEDKSIIECYNLLAHQLCKELGLSRQQFFEISNQLYVNYANTYKETTGSDNIPERGRLLEDLHADLFKLTDCANPNVDFAGGIIAANHETAEFLQIPQEEKIRVSGSKYSMVKGLPGNIHKIAGKNNNIFPHLKEAFLAAQNESTIDVVEELKNGNMLLEVYTCYPPIPIAFLLASKMINNVNELDEFLSDNPITVTGGLSLARAPWNNPALNGLIHIYKKMKNGNYKFGLVHGNGGIGEVQGVAILEGY